MSGGAAVSIFLIGTVLFVLFILFIMFIIARYISWKDGEPERRFLERYDRQRSDREKLELQQAIAWREAWEQDQQREQERRRRERQFFKHQR